MTIYSAIIGNYDTVKEPLVITPGWKYILFTDQDIKSEVWEVRKVELINNDTILTARYYKIMFHEHIEDEFSIWIDGSFTINCDLDKFMAANFKSPMTVVKHPLRNCIYREADVCIQQKRGDRKQIEEQIELYRMEGVPKNWGLIQSGILMREKSDRSILFCEQWWVNIKTFSTRDQIAFGLVSWVQGWPHTIKFNYQTSKEFIFKKHIHGESHGGIKLHNK